MRAILTYHSVDSSGSAVAVSPSHLERQLDSLLAADVAFLPLGQILSTPNNESVVSVTFDDGYRNFLSSAAPLLRERQISATIFVVPEYVGAYNDWEANDSRAAVPRLPLMSWDDLAEIASLGFDIGAHGLRHRSLVKLDDARLRDEIERCREVIHSRIGRSPRAFAFPYGDHDSRTVAAVRKSFPIACTTRFATLDEDATSDALPRLDMFYFGEGRLLRHWGTAPLGAYIGLRRAGRNLRRRMSRAEAN